MRSILTDGVLLVVASVGGSGGITSFRPFPRQCRDISGYGNSLRQPCLSNRNQSGWEQGQLQSLLGRWDESVVVSGGSYLTNPTMNFDSGSAAATLTFHRFVYNPTVPASSNSDLPRGRAWKPNTLAFSQPGAYTNFTSVARYKPTTRSRHPCLGPTRGRSNPSSRPQLASSSSPINPHGS